MIGTIGACFVLLLISMSGLAPNAAFSETRLGYCLFVTYIGLIAVLRLGTESSVNWGKQNKTKTGRWKFGKITLLQKYGIWTAWNREIMIEAQNRYVPIKLVQVGRPGNITVHRLSEKPSTRPGVILFYNSSKHGVDTVNWMVKKYTWSGHGELDGQEVHMEWTQWIGWSRSTHGVDTVNWMVKKYTWSGHGELDGQEVHMEWTQWIGWSRSTHGVDTVNWMVKKYTWSGHGELDGQEVHMEWTRWIGWSRSTHGVDTVNWMVKKYTWSGHGELDGQEVHMEWTQWIGWSRSTHGVDTVNWMVKKYTWSGHSELDGQEVHMEWTQWIGWSRSTHGVDTVNWMVKKYTWSGHGELDGQEVHMEWTRWIGWSRSTHGVDTVNWMVKKYTWRRVSTWWLVVLFEFGGWRSYVSIPHLEPQPYRETADTETARVTWKQFLRSIDKALD